MASLTTLEKVLLVLATAYNRPLDEKTILVYSGFWADLEDERLLHACAQHIQTNSFFPSVAEIRQLALVNEGPDALAAWGEVQAEIKRVGASRPPSFSDEVTETVVAALGWANICYSTNLSSIRARFLEAYQQRAKRRHFQALTEPVRHLLQSLPSPREQDDA